ncbi:MAG: TIGR00269 family protein [Nanoarchaeota archaeon]|nr:TIGR00269 family protein [Nanoarchaeota archaeon]
MTEKCLKCKEEAYCSGFCKKHFPDYFEKKVRRTIRKFELIKNRQNQKGEQKIGVAVSGGKDSTTILYLLKKFGYEPVALTVDPAVGTYSKINLDNIREFCKKEKIKLKEIAFREEFGYSLCYIKSLLNEKGYDYSSCMICGILRRYLLNKYAKEMKLDVLVTGHNLDDEAQAFIMNIFRNDAKLAIRQGPITGAKESKQFVRRIKPLYLTTENEVARYSKLKNFPVKYEKCPCSTEAYRKQYKDMLNEFEKKNPSAKYNIINFFLQTIHPLKKDVKGTANECEICGEPAANKICKKCEIIECLKKSTSETSSKKLKK